VWVGPRVLALRPAQPLRHGRVALLDLVGRTVEVPAHRAAGQDLLYLQDVAPGWYYLPGGGLALLVPMAPGGAASGDLTFRGLAQRTALAGVRLLGLEVGPRGVRASFALQKASAASLIRMAARSGAERPAASTLRPAGGAYDLTLTFNPVARGTPSLRLLDVGAGGRLATLRQVRLPR